MMTDAPGVGYDHRGRRNVVGRAGRAPRRSSPACRATFGMAVVARAASSQGLRSPAPRAAAGAHALARVRGGGQDADRARARSTSRRPTTNCSSSRDIFSLSTEAPVRYSRPSIDVTFASAADSYGHRTVGVVLTGANADGATGCGASPIAAGWRSCRIRRRRRARRCRAAALEAVPRARVMTLAADRGAIWRRCRRATGAGGRMSTGATLHAECATPASAPATHRGRRPERRSRSCSSTTGRRTCSRSRRSSSRSARRLVRAHSGDEALRKLLAARLRGDPARRADAGHQRLRDGAA